MSALNRMGLGCSLALGFGAAIAPAYGAETFEEALRQGDAIIDLRARYESVEQGGWAKVQH